MWETAIKIMNMMLKISITLLKILVKINVAGNYFENNINNEKKIMEKIAMNMLEVKLKIMVK